MSTRFSDPSGRGPSGGALAVRGLIYLSVLAVVATLLMMQSQGAFRDSVRATAVVKDVGDGLANGAEVKLDGVLVGKVDTVESTPGAERHVIRLNLDPRHAGQIPASVKARILPSNVFGAPYVDLVRSDESTTPLAAGATIQGDNSEEAVQLQTAITNTRDVLQAVQPAKLNVALTNMSQALRGKGEQVSSLIGQMHRYVSAVSPYTETLGDSISKLAPVLENLQRNAPDLLDTVHGALVTSKTLIEKQQQFAQALTGGSTTIHKVHGLMNEHAPRGVKIVHELTPVVRTLGRQAPIIPVSFQALGRGVDAFGKAFDPVTGALNLDLEFTVSPYSPYTAADCPVYAGVAKGPNCGDPVPQGAGQPPPAATRAASQPTPGQRFGGLVGSVGSKQEKKQVGSVVGRGAGPLDFFFGPLLRGAKVAGSR